MPSPGAQRPDTELKLIETGLQARDPMGSFPGCEPWEGGGRLGLQRSEREGNLCAVLSGTGARRHTSLVLQGGQLCALMGLSCSLPAALPALKPPGSSVVTSLVSSSSAREGLGCAVSRLGLAKEIRRASQEGNFKATETAISGLGFPHVWSSVEQGDG